MRQIDDTTASSLSTPTDATASTIAGGRAYMADVARRLAPYVARSQSRDRVLAYLRGLLSEAERKTQLASGRSLRRADALWLPVLAEPRRLGRRRRPRRAAHL